MGSRGRRAACVVQLDFGWPAGQRKSVGNKKTKRSDTPPPTSDRRKRRDASKLFGDPASDDQGLPEERSFEGPAILRSFVTMTAMKPSRLNRLIHRWGAIATSVPVLVMLLSGVVLQLKKESAWIQPKTQRGSNQAPQVSFAEILAIAKTVPEAQVQTWDDIDRLDVRPDKGMLKVRCNNRWEVQLDAATGDVLQVAFRRSDLIESIHDGSFFSDAVKLWIFFPTAIVLVVLWGTGVYLFFLPHLAKRRKRLQKS